RSMPEPAPGEGGAGREAGFGSVRPSLGPNDPRRRARRGRPALAIGRRPAESLAANAWHGRCFGSDPIPKGRAPSLFNGGARVPSFRGGGGGDGPVLGEPGAGVRLAPPVQLRRVSGLL